MLRTNFSSDNSGNSSVPYLFLVLLTIANGFGYDVVTWLHTDHNMTLSPVLLLTVIAIIIGLRTARPALFHPGLWTLWCLGVVFPSSTVSWGVLLFVAIFNMWRNTQRDIHVLIVILSLTQIVSAVLSKIISHPILGLESWLIGFFVGFIFDGVHVVDNIIVLSEEYALCLSVGCSAFINMSGVLLAWMSSYYIVRESIPRISKLLIIAIIFFVLNTSRIVIMTVDRSWYDLIHDGYGVQVFDALVVLLVLSPILMRLR